MGSAAYVDLYWLPLGAGGWWVRLNGRAYERLVAWHAGRRPRDLFHSALEVGLDGERYVIEMGPAWGLSDPSRGVVAVGAVGLPWLGRSRLFRYEVRRWPGGQIPDVAEAVESPLRLSSEEALARQVLALVPQFPTYTWGLDEQHTGEMWNSNSLVSWLLACSAHDVSPIRPPVGGRAPGWAAGILAARRHARVAAVSNP